MATIAPGRLAENVDAVLSRIRAACGRVGRDPKDVSLVAVTKYASFEAIAALYELGLRDFGENRPQALLARAEAMPTDVRWHLIGPLQSNKVRRTLPRVALLHSLDRCSLAEAVSMECQRAHRKVDALVQVNLTAEPQKHGFAVADLVELFPKLLKLPGLAIRGLMTMGRAEADADETRATFRELRRLRERLAGEFGVPLPQLSMGMSGDYDIAIEEGATLVRVGSALFAE